MAQATATAPAPALWGTTTTISGVDRMSFATALISALDAATKGAPIPRVRALHLPPPEAAESRSGEFCALELDDGALGLSYVLLGDTLQRLLVSGEADSIVGMDALALARHYAQPPEVARGAAGAGSSPDDQALRRTLGFAAANALSRTVMERMGFAPPRASDSIAGIDPQAGDHIGMVGLFSPLLKQVTAAGAQLTVIELNPEYVGDHDGYRVTLDAAELETCNKVLSTSTILLNHTVDNMLAHCRRASHVALIGPSAGCLPQPLFDRGVSVIGGSWVTDRAGFIDVLRRGDAWGTFAYKFAVTPADWQRATQR